MPNLKRQFAMVEIYTWRDPVFKALPESARMLWFHLMTSPRTTKLPGLLQASVLTVMSDIGWDRAPEGQLRWSEEEIIVRGMQRTNQSFGILEHTLHKGETPWVYVDRTANLIILPRKVAHNIPGNPNIVQGWLNELKEIPPSTGKDLWIINTIQLLRKALGRDDKRVRVMVELERPSRYRLGRDKVGGWGETMAGGSELNSRRSVTRQENSGLSNDLDTKSELLSKDHRSEILDLRSEVGGKAGSHAGTPADDELNLGIEKPADPKPPPDASARLAAIWNAMQTEAFLVPGAGNQTMWNNTRHPEALAKKLDAGAPAVDVAALIRSLAGWTYANPKKAKKNLGRFVWNAAARDQDNPKISQTKRTSTTLAEKVDRSRGGSG